MKAIHKLSKKRKKSKLSAAAKVLIPAAGAVAAKKLWDKKGTEVLEKAGSKVLNKTEEVQEKVQKFHDFLQNSIKESNEATCVDETVEESVEEEVPAQAAEAQREETDGNDEESLQEPEESDEEIFEESEESSKESENN